MLFQLERLSSVPAVRTLRSGLSSPVVLIAWAALVLPCLGVLWWDIRQRNQALPSLMKLVWALVVLYSGPLGLAVYWYAGRTQIERDSLWRRGVRSTAHCYSGCGAGEVVGITIAAGPLSLGQSLAIAVTFAFAYTFGYALTVGPLVQEGETVVTAVEDAFYSETPSITVMEVTAIGTDVLLAGQAALGDALFRTSLVLSLSIGFWAAFPVNALLVKAGVKEGMQNPATMA